MDNENEVLMSDLVKPDLSNDLNNMPPFADIEDLTVLKETAEEEITRLRARGGKAAKEKIRQIKLALAEVAKAHHTADHHDAGEQCPERPMVRRGRIA